MRHRVAHRKLGRVTSHRIATLRSLATSLFERERIRTTLAKAKELRPFAEKLITLARRDDDRVHARRLVGRDIRKGEVVRKLFDNLGSRYATRPGGYTRILKLGPRRGDGAEMAIVELIGSEFKLEQADAAAGGDSGKAREKKAGPKGASARRKAGAESAKERSESAAKPSRRRATPAKKG